jgi:5-methylcytosine-specific restriction endonuclease McrA
MEVLLLNASEEVLDIIDWMKAVRLLFAEKADKPFNHEDYYTIKTSSGHYKLPSVIILKEYVYVPHRKSKSPCKKNVYRRDGNRCQYCGCALNYKNSSIDHVMPRSRGGSNSWDNIVSACKPCNRRKGNRTPEEAGMPLHSKPEPPTRAAIIHSMLSARKPWERWARYLVS